MDEWMRRWSVQHPSVLVIALVRCTSRLSSNNNVVDQMQMLGSGVYPVLNYYFLPVKGVGDREIVFCTLGQEEYTIGVDIPYPLFSNGATLCCIILTHFNNEVPVRVLVFTVLCFTAVVT